MLEKGGEYKLKIVRIRKKEINLQKENKAICLKKLKKLVGHVLLAINDSLVILQRDECLFE